VRNEDDAELARCQVIGDVVRPDEGSWYLRRGTTGDGAVKRSLTEGSGVEGRNVIIFYGKADLDWFAAHFAVLDVGLSPDGQVQEHRNLFTTIGAAKLVFHSVAGLGFPFS